MFQEITPYNEYNSLRIGASYRKNRGGIVVSITPVCRTSTGYSHIFDFSQDPLTAGMDILTTPLTRDNKKRVEGAFQHTARLAPQIAELWNKRDFEGIKSLIH